MLLISSLPGCFNESSELGLPPLAARLAPFRDLKAFREEPRALVHVDRESLQTVETDDDVVFFSHLRMNSGCLVQKLPIVNVGSGAGCSGITGLRSAAARSTPTTFAICTTRSRTRK